MDQLESTLSVDTYPAELLLALNKATTVSWRLGVAWTLISKSGEVLTCNGNLFNQHTQLLLEDLQTYCNAKKLYISYCPVGDDLHVDELINALRLSRLVELHIFTHEKNKQSVADLLTHTAIPTVLWPSNKAQSAQTNGIAWVRSTSRPWVHIVCANTIGGGGSFPEKMMADTPGVIPYVTLKGIESSLLYVQNDRPISFSTQLQMADPQFFESCEVMLQNLVSLSTEAASAVTIVCDPSWLAQIIQMKLANEVSYFLTLRATTQNMLTVAQAVDFPKSDHWYINSSEVMGDFIRVILQKR